MTHGQALLLGLTGGIGSGKSTAAKTLQQLGAHVVDADCISRQLTAAGGLAIPLIRQRFGDAFVTSDGAMDRAKMRQQVFQNPAAKAELEAIMHPLIYRETDLQAQHARDKGCSCVVFDLPLLVESGRWRTRLDHVLVIDCEPQVQMARVIARSQLAPDEVRRIMEQQAPRTQRLAAADTVINNSLPDFAHLTYQLQQFMSFVRRPVNSGHLGLAKADG